jgi:hypothetical protein
MLPSPNSSPQREALTNCTNITSEAIHGLCGLPTPPEHGLVKRPRPSNNGGARPKRLKFTIEESRIEEEDKVDSDESEEDSDLASSMLHKKRTVFHARYALAVSRPGVTCRPLPCRSHIHFPSRHSADSLSTDSLATPCLCVVAQDRRVRMQFGQNGFILNPTICVRIYP